MAEVKQKKLEGSGVGILSATSEEETVSDLGFSEESTGVATAEVSHGCGGYAGAARSRVKGTYVAADGFYVGEDAQEFPNKILLSASMHEIERDSKNPLMSFCLETSLQLSPTSVTQSNLSIPSPTPLEQPSMKKDAAFGALQEDRGKVQSPRSLSLDGYRWRKYGQKQIKSPPSSRSYYRCTNTQCAAKKIECSDGLGHILESIYRSQHNHASPKKINGLSGSTVQESVGPAQKRYLIDCSSRGLGCLDPSISSRKVVHQLPSIPTRRKYISDNEEDVAMSAGKQQQASGGEPKQRVKRIKLLPECSPLQSGKDVEGVVDAADHVEASNDGYRWKKYGKKMMKGNQHLRNYYRCSSAGCQARKQIETTSDDTDTVIITYKGKHDHEKPVNRKRHGWSRVHSLSSTPPKAEDMSIEHRTSSQGLVDSDSDLTGKAMELGGEKAMESARTLLSMGLEVKSCQTAAG
ncbi:hypothetical protein MLD38_006308 [Melastoma candidum]|uniref:Uncharacterized protein n=1 Tax=Melastoma candidum TaxID=119954 RepID=A0ACB9RMG6_9MYRT|nr:hypothetical protein MLD38_006308 [Melastoma candidum]